MQDSSDTDSVSGGNALFGGAGERGAPPNFIVNSRIHELIEGNWCVYALTPIGLFPRLRTVIDLQLAQWGFGNSI